jgi:tRNA G26 N,N-dimethylase Trm1
MTKSILRLKLDSVKSAIPQRTDRTILDLEIYLSNSSHLRSCIYDHREIQSIAERFGLSPERIRSELRRLGYQLTKNGHGRMIWKCKEGERMNYAKRIVSLEEYISKCEARQLQFFDRSELGRIAKIKGVDRDSVRAALRRRGYKLSRNGHNIAIWMKMQGTDPRSPAL